MAQTAHLDTKHLDHAADVAKEAVGTGMYGGAVIAVANSRETVWTHVVPGEDQVTQNSIFLLASISKPITACAIMRLVEQGKLLLDKPVAAYLPEFGNQGKEAITPFHLLTHSNGLNESRWMQARTTGQPEIGSCFEEACAAPLLFTPGSRAQYGTLSYSILGELITRVTGQTYPDYLRDEVFAPLGMRDTAFAPTDEARAVPVRNFVQGALLQKFVARAIPGGGLWSTASDLVAFGQTLLRGGVHGDYSLLSPATIEAMTRVQIESTVEWEPGFPVPFKYGLGWGKGAQEDGGIGSSGAFSHGGASGTLLCIDPQWDLVFVYLTNRWGDSNETAHRALNAVYGALRL